MVVMDRDLQAEKSRPNCSEAGDCVGEVFIHFLQYQECIMSSNEWSGNGR